jgi:hypothetical protein
MFRVLTTEGAVSNLVHETPLAAVALGKAVRVSQTADAPVRVERNGLPFCSALRGQLRDHTGAETTLEALLAKLSQPGV